MPSYTVQKGDTLSGIGAKMGVDWRQIGGYRSGNANLIYPGEVVSWGGAPAPAPQAQAAPAAPANNWENETNSIYGEVGNFDKTRANPLDTYNAALERLGISDARTRVTDLRQQLLNTENLVRGVEGNVSSRTQNALVTENQRQRLVAQERDPLVQQAGIMGRNLEMANADYQGILGEGKTQSEMQYKGESDKRQALMDRLQIAIDRSDNETKKRQWQAEFDRLQQKDREEAARWQQEFALKQQEAARSAASSRSSGGSSSKASSKPTVADLFSGYKKGTDKWYTEKTVIPTLMSTYGYSKDKAAKLAYEYRKSVFGE